MRIALCRPEIPQNTGNVIRLAANIGAPLDLIHPLGFVLDDSRLRRAGLDYHELVDVCEWSDIDHWRAAMADRRVWALTRYGDVCYDSIDYRHDDILLFGAETRGLPADVAADCTARVYIPMQPGNRSLNLGNSVSVVAFEAWRQLSFC
ncbi:tRNA (cytidine(34)-2'-O)-methyltransferase [Salinisphaera sp. USBA-960]|uniref:tRNA (cytidine(34)-2'-O)-methyltransferase n=1 Tax=Salinisphaera orenii TaxID=856731 RepID=UPI000DBE7D3E|nr:tRNA (cytidine(34)-2'-O)-methyltransferase [Salifodinibacter halophilus]NNC26870.1 tRNA (cytidine(34)-2'-O)-methyltransferase [Salifodinibacter halophilus]